MKIKCMKTFGAVENTSSRKSRIDMHANFIVKTDKKWEKATTNQCTSILLDLTKKIRDPSTSISQ